MQIIPSKQHFKRGFLCVYLFNQPNIGCLIQGRPIGILYTVDNAGDDPKIIAVPAEAEDPRWNEMHHRNDLGHPSKETLLLLFKQINIREHNNHDKIEKRIWKRTRNTRRNSHIYQKKNTHQ